MIEILKDIVVIAWGVFLGGLGLGLAFVVYTKARLARFRNAVEKTKDKLLEEQLRKLNERGL